MWGLVVIIFNYYVAYVAAKTLIWRKKYNLISHYEFRKLIVLALICTEQFYESTVGREEEC